MESQAEIFVSRDNRLKVRSYGKKKTAGKGEKHEVTEKSAQDKKECCQKNKGNNIFLFFLVEAWSNELPELIKNEGRSEENRR